MLRYPNRNKLIIMTCHELEVRSQYQELKSAVSRSLSVERIAGDRDPDRKAPQCS
jgi:hypothetical protein